MHVNSPTDSTDFFGGLSTTLDDDGLLTKYVVKGLTHAYSVSRKLVSQSNNLQAFRVRRSSDDAEQDIGFIGNSVDTASLLSFVGAGDGFVKTLYDQVGTNDATQTTNNLQGRVVNSGSLELDNGKLRIRFIDTTVRSYSVSTQINLSTGLVFLHTFNNTSGATSGSLKMTEGASSSDATLIAWSSGTIILRQASSPTISNVTTISNNTLYSACYTFSSSTGNGEQWVDNTSIGTGSTNAGTYTIDSIFVSDRDASTSELLIVNKVLNETDRYNINKNIDDFYGI